MFRSHVFRRLSGVTKSFSKTSEKDNVTKALNIATCLASLVEIAIAILNVLERVYARINNKVNLGCRAPAVLPMLWLPPLALMADLPRLTAIESIMSIGVKARRPCLDLLEEFMPDSFYRPPAKF